MERKQSNQKGSPVNATDRKPQMANTPQTDDAEQLAKLEAISAKDILANAGFTVEKTLADGTVVMNFPAEWL